MKKDKLTTGHPKAVCNNNDKQKESAEKTRKEKENDIRSEIRINRRVYRVGCQRDMGIRTAYSAFCRRSWDKQAANAYSGLCATIRYMGVNSFFSPPATRQSPAWAKLSAVF